MVVNVYVSAVTADNVSRHELLAWINQLLKTSFTKIEEMYTGAAYCQLTDMLFPGAINLKKVKWTSVNEVDYLNNWKLLQTSWNNLGVEKRVPVDRLIKSKFQDNYEFLQWYFKFHNANSPEDLGLLEYDPVAARGGEVVPTSARGPRGPVRNGGSARPAGAVPSTRPAAVRPTSAAPLAARASRTAPPVTATTAQKSSNGVPREELQKAVDERDSFKQQLEEVLECSTTFEKERDFYFSKLRQVEEMLNSLDVDEQPDKEQLLAVLYETDTPAAEEGNAEEEAPAPAELDDSETF